MSTSKKQPLVFPSIKVGAYPPPPSATPPAPLPPSPPPAPEPAALAPQPPALEMKEPEPESRALSPSPPETSTAPAPAPFAGIATSRTRLAPPEPAANRWPYILAAIASLLWAAGLVALIAGNVAGVPPFQVGALNAMIMAVLAIAPLGFIWAAAYAVTQAGALVAEARRAKQLTDEMLGPAAVAAVETGAIVEAVRGQILSATEAAAIARDRLTELREALAVESQRLAEAAQTADRSARGLTEAMIGERKELGSLSVTLDARAAAVTDAITRQHRMVTEASDLAEVQLREAEASLAGRAADMAAAAMEANDAARTAGEDLARQIARLETAGLGVGDQMRSLEEGLTTQRASLVTVAHALRADQEDFAALAESRTAQLSGFLAGASKDVAALSEVTTLGAQSISDLIAAAAEKFRELAQSAKAERDLFAQSAVGSLNELTAASDRERKALEEQMRSTIAALSAAASEAREAADIHAEAARARVDQLNEAAFAAGQKADQVFEARLSEARGLIEQSAALVEEAGAKTAARLDQGAAQARATLEQLQRLVDETGARTAARLEEGAAHTRASLEQLQRMVEEVGARTATLPAETGAKAEEVRAAFAKGMDGLMASARQAAQETQTIDAAFQERVKRNYEMLSEAVQLMGVVAQGGQAATGSRRTPPANRLRGGRAAPEAVAPAAASAEPEPMPANDESQTAILTATEEEFNAALAAASGQPAESEAGWTWKELLTSIDGDDAAADAQMGQGLFREIEDMGIDPAALLSRTRIEEIAAAIQTHDVEGAREVVRTLAPAAIRRLSRRLISDREFRQRCVTYVGRYAAVIDEASKRDKEGFQAASLLNSNVGRAYLLLDAAAGDDA
jgi:hypothetical protein